MGEITVTGLGKAFRSYPTKAARLSEWFLPFLGRKHNEIRVLRDISFSVHAGEAVGIIGTNGAGKSTLLKLITGIIRPTEGSVSVGGRLAAMLELGLGFHPDFSGRDNAVMALKLQGYTAEDAAALLPGIIDFAELGAFFDRPLRVYSTGMQVRLGFAVATAVRPDILIVDEALAVGDAYFQQKSFGRIRDFRAQGTTLLIVSHDKAAIQSICSRAILIDKGRIERDGDPEMVFNYYNALISVAQDKISEAAEGDTVKATVSSGTGEARIERVRLLDSAGAETETFDVGATATVAIDIAVYSPVPTLCIGIEIKDRLGQAMFGTNTVHTGQALTGLAGGDRVRTRIALPLGLGTGSYSISLALAGDATHVAANYHWIDRVTMFEIVNASKPYFIGSAHLDASFTSEVARD